MNLYNLPGNRYSVVPDVALISSESVSVSSVTASLPLMEMGTPAKYLGTVCTSTKNKEKIL